jgi:hypothetical protein
MDGMSALDRTAEASYRPWFQRRPGLTLSVSLALFVAIAGARVAMGRDASVGITMLFVLPISLLGLARGRLYGVAAGVAGLSFTGLWVALEGVELPWVVWLTRAIPFLLVGYLLGDASERLEQAEEQRLRAEARSLRQRQAVEVNDILVQGMAAAKWSIESGRVEAGLETLQSTIEEGHRLVSQLLREGDELDGAAARRREPADQ